jgi:hypothetical protein
LPTITDSDQKFVGLHAVFPDSNFLALNAAGNYTVNWGDGLTENFSSGVTANHIFDYSNSALTGTDCSRGYKQAIVTVTPQAGQNLTTLNLHKIHNQTGLQKYASGFLDIAIAGSSLSSLLIGVATAGSASTNIRLSVLEQICLYSNLVSSFGYIFYNCYSLQSIPLLDTAAGTNFNMMFGLCSKLQSIPPLNTAFGTNFVNMFNSCYSLKTIPLLNTAGGTANAFSSMFYGCYSLQTIPLLNTAAGTDFSNMFYGCYSLQTIPLINTGASTNFSSMFYNCYSLQSISFINTAAGTNFNSMFYNCYILQTIPLLNTAAGTDFSNMFYGCYSLQTIPLLNTAAGNIFSSIFGGTTFSTFSLSAGALSGSKYTISYTNCKLSQNAIESIITNIGTAAGAQTLTISNNWGAASPISKSGTSTAGSATITMASTTGIVAGMQVTGTGSPLTTALACTLQDSGDTVTATAHGLSNGDLVSFKTIVTTTGIDTYTPYYVVGAATDTFQVSLTAGGAAIALTTDGSGTILYRALVVTVNTNVSVVLDKKMTGSGTATFAYRLLNTGLALQKGWTVTG